MSCVMDVSTRKLLSIFKQRLQKQELVISFIDECSSCSITSIAHAHYLFRSGGSKKKSMIMMNVHGAEDMDGYTPSVSSSTRKKKSSPPSLYHDY